MLFLCQNHNLITCLLRKMHFYVQIVIILESNKIFKCNLLDIWPKSSSVNSINLVKKSATIPEI